MDKSGADAFVFAKANGILGKSFVKNRAPLLFEAKSLTELWTLIFKTQPPAVPEVMLAQEIENKAFENFIKAYTQFISCYDKPDPVLTDQLFIYEAENLKEIGAALCSGESKLPSVVNLGDNSVLHYDQWPDIAAITKGTVFSWYDHVPGIHEQQSLDFKIDLQVCRHLWQSIYHEKGEAHAMLEKLYKREFIIQNIVWSLRMRLYYNMKKEDIIPLLIHITDRPNMQDPVAAPAIKLLDWPLDEYERWENWKYASLLNPREDGQVWQIDPVWIERKNKFAVNKMAEVLFHQFPSDSCFLIGWYKIKDFELSCIRTAVESLRFNVSAQDAMNAVGIASQGGLNG